jgi:DDE superfamily endonuclease
MARSDQRAKGMTYLRGLLLDGRRKSMQPMAKRLGVDHQGLQQFVTTSTWDTAAVWSGLARRAVDLVGPAAWVVDDTRFPKGGEVSPGWPGSTAVSVHAVSDTASCPQDRRSLPQSWDDAAVDDAVRPEVIVRRKRCGIPPDERHRPKWMTVFEMLDELAGCGLRPPALAADGGYGDNASSARAYRNAGSATWCRSRVRPPLTRACAPSAATPACPPVRAVCPSPQIGRPRLRPAGQRSGRSGRSRRARRPRAAASPAWRRSSPPHGRPAVGVARHRRRRPLRFGPPRPGRTGWRRVALKPRSARPRGGPMIDTSSYVEPRGRRWA